MPKTAHSVEEENTVVSLHDEFHLFATEPQLLIVSTITVTDPQPRTTRRGETEVFEVKFEVERPSTVTGYKAKLYGKHTVWKGTSDYADKAQDLEQRFWNLYGHYSRYNGRPVASILVQDIKDNTYVSQRSSKPVQGFTVGSLDFLTMQPEQYSAQELLKQYLKEQQESTQQTESIDDDDADYAF